MNWKTIRRSDRQNLVEHVCECGVGHPAFGSALWIAESIHGPDSDKVGDEVSAQLVHGCCGCCKRDDFPGTPVESLKYAHKLISESRTNTDRPIGDVTRNLLEEQGIGDKMSPG